MKAVFRVDSSNSIGSGHIIRCITLAKELRKNDFDCSFICRDHPKNISTKIEESGFKLFLLPPIEKKIDEDNLHKDHKRWLGIPQEDDAHQTNEILKSLMPEWLIVDHYSIDHIWQNLTRPYSKHLMVIDDLADRAHNCDLLLDQNFYLDKETRYIDKVPSRCIKLLGPEYALLHEEFSIIRNEINLNKKFSIKNILVFFGGSDNYNLTELAINAIYECFGTNVSINVVLSKNNDNYKDIELISKKNSNLTLFSNLPTLAYLMNEADIAIGAGGTTNWERSCLGLPTLVITIADNQIKTCNHLSKKNYIELIGAAQTVELKDIVSSIKKIQSRKDTLDWSKKLMMLCSGDGSSEVTKHLLKTSNKS